MNSYISFPAYSGLRCLMMPFIQGDPESIPETYAAYAGVISTMAIERGRVGYLTIDESMTTAGDPHRGARAKYGRALHTEAGRIPGPMWCWGTWGGNINVLLERDVKVMLASNIDCTCAIWDCVHDDTSIDGDIGDKAWLYPYAQARFLAAGEIGCIGILTPHESIPLEHSVPRQFIRIVSSGVHGREPYFTQNPLGLFS